MKTLITTFIIVFLSASLVWAQTVAPKKVITPVRVDKSSALRDIAKTYSPSSLRKKTGSFEIPLKPSPLRESFRNKAQGTGILRPDPAWQQSQGALGIVPSQSFEGLSDEDNANINGFQTVPPDPNGDVGPNHYVQMINNLFAVYDKTGNTLLGPLPNNALWAGFGGPCEFDNDGDPIVLYDPLADRWLLTQFAVSSGSSVCMACSETSDPTGAYFRYEFPFENFPDYPKYGVWPDAYYATFRVFGETFDMTAAAIEREKILVGDPSAQMILFSISDALAPTTIDGVLPVDLDGPPPPAGTPGFFLGHQDDAFTGAPEDRLVMFALSVDWANPANSTFNGPTFLPTDSFDISVFSVAQPFPGESLDAIPEFMMHRLAFRNFGTHMAMVANHTVNVGDFDNHAGIRWYELRNEGSGWNIFQQGTYAPNADNRWMGSIAMDGKGNIALGYSVSGNKTFPSIHYTARTSDAPLGEMNIIEQSIIEGTGAQIGSFSRWGDYSMMTVDPTDDATFWYTNEYYAETSAYNFRTRIGAFDLEPLPGTQIQVFPPNIDFGIVFVGQSSDSATVQISNIGDKDLIITNISGPGPPFSLINVPALPVTIPTFGSETFEVVFSPKAEGDVSDMVSITSNDADDPTIDVKLSGEVIDLTNVEALIWNPTSLLTSQQVVAHAASTRAEEITEQEAQVLIDAQAENTNAIAAALDANGISNMILSTQTLPTSIQPNIKYLFVILGQPPANYIIFNGSPEAASIENFIASGGHVYMEGGDVWVYDPFNAGGHNFNPTFGIEPIADGMPGGELVHIVGSSIAEGQNFDYNVGTDNYPDHIDPTGTGFLVHTNIGDLNTFNCGVANPLGVADSLTRGRTIGTSFEFGQLIDGDSPDTKTTLMANYINFFDHGFALEGPQILVTPDSIEFEAKVGDTSQVVPVIIQNIGSEDLTITHISDPGAPFNLIDLPALPLVLPSGGIDTFAVAFMPTSSGIENGIITITSNDADDPTIDVLLTGKGLSLPPRGTLFASTGTQGSSLITVNPATGIGTFVGSTEGFGPVTEIEFREDGTLFGATGGGTSTIITLDVTTGAPTLVGVHDFGAVNGLEFDAAGTLYGAYIEFPGGPSQLVTVDTETGALTYIGPTGFGAIGGLAFTSDGTLYGTTAGDSSGGNFITLDTATGMGTLIGPTGFNNVPALEFGPDGILYGGIGGNNSSGGSLITIDPNTGEGTFVGSTGFPAISGLSFFPKGFESEIIADVICPPKLSQNCPVSIDIQIDMSGSSERLGSFTGILTWDSTMLVYTGNSGIQSDFTGVVNSENAASGKLIFNGANPSGASDKISILTVEFDVIGPLAENGMIDLEFSSMAAALTFVDLLPDLAVNDCDFIIDTSNYLLGDLNGDELVNSADALICLSFDAGLPIPVEFEERIDAGLGDVNGDMVTNSTDCLIILTFDVGIPVPFPVGEPVCPKENIPLASLPVARKMAALNGSGSITATAHATNSKITYGKTVDVPVIVNMSGLTETLGSATAILKWDPTVLRFEEFTGGTSLGFNNPLVNISEVRNGKLTFAHAQVNETKGSVNLLNVKFKVMGEIGLSSALDLSFQTLTAGNTFYDLLPLLKVEGHRVASKVEIIPEAYALSQNYPNPFHPETEINYQLPEANQVEIGVYNIFGKSVRVLVNRQVQAGNYKVIWDGKNDSGETVRSGTYIIRMIAGDFVADRKMVFMKE